MRRREAAGPSSAPDLDVVEVRIHPRKRLALLEEIVADVDALEDELAARGLPRGRARAAAVHRLFPDPTVARELETEAVAYRRLVERVGRSRIASVERFGLFAVAALTLASLASGLARVDGFRTGGVFLWLTIGLIGLLVANTSRVAFGLWVRQDMGAARRREAWRVQVGLVLVATSIAALGAVSEAYLAAGRMEVNADWVTGFQLARDVAILVAMGLAAMAIGLIGWLSLTPSLRSYDTFEHQIATLFAPAGPQLVRDRADHTTDARTEGAPAPEPEQLNSRKEVVS